MATTHKCVQGDSFAYDFSCKEVPIFDANWGGLWSIVDSLDDVSDGNNIVSRANGSLVRSSDDTKLELRVQPAQTNAIPVGTYYLVVQATNSSIGFNQEIMQDEFEITEQGIG